jgi:hypothetical protein
MDFLLPPYISIFLYVLRIYQNIFIRYLDIHSKNTIPELFYNIHYLNSEMVKIKMPRARGEKVERQKSISFTTLTDMGQYVSPNLFRLGLEKWHRSPSGVHILPSPQTPSTRIRDEEIPKLCFFW